MAYKNEKLVARFLLLVYAVLTVAPLLHLSFQATSVSSADCQTLAYDFPSFSAPCDNPDHHHGDHHDEHQCSICRMANAAQAVVSPSWQIGDNADGTLLALPTSLIRHDIDHHAICTRAPPRTI